MAKFKVTLDASVINDTARSVKIKLKTNDCSSGEIIRGILDRWSLGTNNKHELSRYQLWIVTGTTSQPIDNDKSFYQSITPFVSREEPWKLQLRRKSTSSSPSKKAHQKRQLGINDATYPSVKFALSPADMGNGGLKSSERSSQHQLKDQAVLVEQHEKWEKSVMSLNQKLKERSPKKPQVILMSPDETHHMGDEDKKLRMLLMEAKKELAVTEARKERTMRSYAIAMSEIDSELQLQRISVIELEEQLDLAKTNLHTVQEELTRSRESLYSKGEEIKHLKLNCSNLSESFHSSISDKDVTIDALKNSIIAEKQANLSLQSTLKNLEAELVTSQSKAEAMGIGLHQSESSVKDLRQKLKEAKNAYKLKVKLTNLELRGNQIEKVEREREALKNEAVHLKTRLKDAEESKQSFKDQLHSMENEMTRLKTEKSTLLTKLSKTEERLQEAMKGLEGQLDNDREQMKHEVAILKQENRNLVSSLAEVQTQAQNHKREKQLLEKETEEQRRQKEELFARFKKEKGTTEKLMTRMKEQLNHLTEERNQIQSQLEDAFNENAKLLKSEGELKGKLKKAQQNLLEFQRETSLERVTPSSNETSPVADTSLHTRIDALAVKIESLSAQKPNHEDAKERESENSAIKEAKIIQLLEQNSTLTTEIERLKLVAANFENMLKEIKEKAAKSEETNKTKIAKCKEELSALKTTNENLSLDITQHKQNSSMLQEEIDKLIKEHKEEKERIQKELNKEKEKFDADRESSKQKELEHQESSQKLKMQLEAEIGTLHDALSHANASIKSNQEQLLKLQTLNSTLTQTDVTLKSQMQELKLQSENEQKAKAETAAELDKVNANNSELLIQLKNAEVQITSEQSQSLSLKEEINKLNEKIRLLELEINETVDYDRSQLVEAKEEKDAIAHQLESEKENIEQLKAQFEDLKSQLEREKNDIQLQLVASEKQATELKNECANVSDNLKLKIAENGELLKKLHEQETALSESNEQIESYRSQHLTAEQTNSALKNEIQTITAKNDQISSRLKEQEESLDKLRIAHDEKMTEVQLNLDSLLNENNELKRLKESNEQHIVQLQKEVEDKASKSEEEKKALCEDYESQISKMKQSESVQMSELRDELNHVKTQTSQEKEQLTAALSELHETNESLSVKYEERQKQLNALVSENSLLSANVESINLELQQHKSQLLQAKEQEASLCTEITSLKSEIESLKLNLYKEQGEKEMYLQETVKQNENSENSQRSFTEVLTEQKKLIELFEQQIKTLNSEKKDLLDRVAHEQSLAEEKLANWEGQMKETSKSFKDEISQLNDEVKQLNSQLQQVNESKTATSNELKDAKDRNEKLTQKEIELSSKIDLHLQEIDKLNVEINELKVNNEKIQLELSEEMKHLKEKHSGDISTLNDKLAEEKAREKETMEAQVNEEKKQKEKLQFELDQFKVEFNRHNAYLEKLLEVVMNNNPSLLEFMT
jgi:chromosome segregation ATPase